MTLRLPRRRFLAGATGFVGALSLPWRAKAADPFRIFMITFRGETDVERGYRDYLAQRRIAVDITLRDAERDAKKVAAFVEEIRDEGREARLLAVEASAARECERHLHEREFTVLDDMQRRAVSEPLGRCRGNGERRRRRECRSLGAIEGGLLCQRGRGGCGECDVRECEPREEGARVDHWTIPRVAASSFLPCGTMLSVTRPLNRYCFTTRCTSAAVTLR